MTVRSRTITGKGNRNKNSCVLWNQNHGRTENFVCNKSSESRGKDMNTTHELRIKLHGRPASKKNSRQLIHARGRAFFIPSKAYADFCKYALVELLTVRRFFPKPIDTPVKIQYTFYQKGKLSQDGDNAMVSINDVLQEAGIIADDKLIKKWSGEIIGGQREWWTEIHLEW